MYGVGQNGDGDGNGDRRGNGDSRGMPQAAEDLIRAWRRSPDEPLPPELRAALQACDNGTLFNVLRVTIDLLLRRITPVRENKRARRALKFRRRNLRRALERTEERIVAHDAASAECGTSAPGCEPSMRVRADSAEGG